jgi:CRISPR-associated endonuclease/helicase Cas3
MNASYFQYWGKARKDEQLQGDSYHLLPYHSLDVAAVAAHWWDHSASLRRSFAGDAADEKQIRAWVLFFIALHDLGKFDVRFQCKSLDSWLALHPESAGKALPSAAQCKGFDHGKAGLYWFREDRRSGSPESMDDWLSMPVNFDGTWLNIRYTSPNAAIPQEGWISQPLVSVTRLGDPINPLSLPER